MRCQLSFEDRPVLTCCTEVVPKTLKFCTFRLKNRLFEGRSIYLIADEFRSLRPSNLVQDSPFWKTPKNLWFAEIDKNTKKDEFIHSFARFSDKNAQLVDFWI